MLRPVAFFLGPASGAPPYAAVDLGASQACAGGYRLADVQLLVAFFLGPASGATPYAAIDLGATRVSAGGLLHALRSRSKQGIPARRAEESAPQAEQAAQLDSPA